METETHPLIQVEDISKRFGNVAAVSGVSFEIQRGEIVGFLGPNGAGKTTTMRLLTGFYRPDTGRVRIDGLDTQEHDLKVKRGIGYLPENNPLYSELPVVEHLSLTSELRGIPRAERKNVFERVVEETGLESVYYRPVNQLSKGFRQRVGLALAILHEPDVLILDEPTEGLDPNQRVEIRELIRDLGRAHTVLLSTHVMQEVEQTCERLLVINHGSLVADAPVQVMLRRGAGTDRQVVVDIEAPDVSAELGRLPGVSGVTTEPTVPGRYRYVLSVSNDQELTPQVFSLAARNGWILWELRVEAPSLEDIFRSLTSSE